MLRIAHKTTFGLRFLTTERKSVSVVGSGPSGFYTVCRLLAKAQIPLDVTLWEKLPVPFGLSRYGVAPDHPEVKNCEDTFSRCAEEFAHGTGKGHSFRFVGNVDVGRDVKLKKLLETQDAVVLSYGCSGDHKLGIPGENTTAGVFTSREIVNWYNGHPEYSGVKDKLSSFDWSKVRRVGIIGNGNVALDITRVLLSNQIKDIWTHTDINPEALKALNEAPVENVKLIARRDFSHSKFTNKEFRELWELERFGIRGTISPEFFKASQFDMKNAERVFKRRVEMVSEYMLPFDQRTKKNYKKHRPPSTIPSRTWEMDYLKTPLTINGNSEGKLESLTLCRNILTQDNKLEQRKSDTLNYDLDLLITSLGYGSSALEEFDALQIGFATNRIANTNGYVLDTNGVIVRGLFAAGWIRRGSSGVIASTMSDAFEVADAVIAELESGSLPKNKDVDLSRINYTTWDDWEKIDKEERSRGQLQGKPRVKFLSTHEMLQFLRK
ncbi:LANO_0H21990g1_1 [Lachancea nothofagi CBS 11611]|uniref:NADPH:adrenodoxin oxidoreductase, mitochondrial n=1 Tax=Lachancea nothofagi CBS 11611 TaxID=1266666 RepID=A0A1G4KNG6_9SACH|nr:LANO_0H21990g1_1 [Lachancea nothofagi CBS 11611]